MDNVLKECACLFVNGQFRAKQNDYARPIVGVKTRHGNYEIQLGYPQESVGWYNAERCMLIARPIEDMTDGEIYDTPKFKSSRPVAGIEGAKEILKEKAWADTMMRRDFLYLLSIGVYPFDQNHFDDGTVIDSRTL